VKPQYTGTWRITEMESWDEEYVNLVGPGHLTIEQDGSGSMRFGAVDVGLDCRVDNTETTQKINFTFQGFDEGDPISGRGWATISGSEMTGRIHFHNGDESGFKAVKTKLHRVPFRDAPKGGCPDLSWRLDDYS
jgi:hypothetical protein